MKEGSQSNVLKTTLMAGVIGSAATAVYFLMRNKDSRKKILSGIDAAWSKLSELEAVEETVKKSPVKRVLETITGGTDDTSKSRASKNGK